MPQRPRIAAIASHHTVRAALACVLMSTVATAALAQGAQPSTMGGRFTMHPADGGVLRLDTQTGAMSMCKGQAGQWSCESLSDERRALQGEIDRLAVENKDLKDSIKRLEDIAGLPDPGGKTLERHANKGPGGIQMPTEEDVDKAMSYVQRMLKKFKDKLREFEDPDGKRTEKL